MDAATPWLLLIIAALIVVSVSLYSHARQVESHALGRQLLVADELREAEAALLAALEKLRQMDTVLVVRERNLACESWRAIPDGPASALTPMTLAADGDDGCRISGVGETDESSSAAGERVPDDRETVRRRVEGEGKSESGEKKSGPVLHPSRLQAGERTGRLWPSRAAELARSGMTAAQIARELELPVGEVELALALGQRPSSSL